jgi:hypothetical protein
MIVRMSKEDMINWLLRDIEADRFRAAAAVGPRSVAGAQFDRAAERSRLQALSYGEIEARYFRSEELYALSA